MGATIELNESFPSGAPCDFSFEAADLKTDEEASSEMSLLSMFYSCYIVSVGMFALRFALNNYLFKSFRAERSQGESLVIRNFS